MSWKAERLEIVLPVAAVCAVYSFGYTLWQLPPQIRFGTFGLVVGGDLVPMLLVPLLVVRFALRRSAADYGLRRPGRVEGAVAALAGWLAVMPLVWVLSRRPEFQAFYPSPAFPPARQHAFGLAVLWLLHHGPQLLATEFLYRGFVLQPLARAFGIAVALAATTVPYVALHATKPGLELIEALWAGVVFGAIAWRTRSIWPAFLAHWAVAVSMDALCLHFAGRG
jgi:membrane protease YdiL (CAAX protease family)